VEPGLSSLFALSKDSDCPASFPLPFYQTRFNSLTGKVFLLFNKHGRAASIINIEETTMARRLYFMLPDVVSACQIRDELLLARIEDRHIHVLAKDGIPLDGLHEASILQKTDLVHGAETGLAIGGAIGIVAGLVAILFPPGGVSLNLVTILITALIGAAFGAWVSSMVASSIPNSRLKTFEEGIAQGRILFMVDVPGSRVDEVKSLIARHHPEAASRGVEPTIPAFP
jgi:hypothetical protein